MTVTPQAIIQSQYAPNVQTTVYTASSRRCILDKFAAYNGTVGPVTLTVNIVPVSGTAGASNVLVSKSVAAGETYIFPELVGFVLGPGDFISLVASAATSLVIRAAGREVT